MIPASWLLVIALTADPAKIAPDVVQVYATVESCVAESIKRNAGMPPAAKDSKVFFFCVAPVFST